MDKAVEKELRLFSEALPGIKSGNDFNKYVRIVEKFDEKSYSFSSIIYIERNTDKGVEIIQSIIDILKEFYEFKKKKDMVTRKVIIEYSNEI